MNFSIITKTTNFTSFNPCMDVICPLLSDPYYNFRSLGILGLLDSRSGYTNSLSLPNASLCSLELEVDMPGSQELHMAPACLMACSLRVCPGTKALRAVVVAGSFHGN